MAHTDLQNICMNTAMKSMKQRQIFFLLVALFSVRNASANAPRVVDLKTPDGTILKGTYFAAAKPGPGALLFHQSNRTRKSWDDVARQLAAAGINTLTVDVRGHGDTGGNFDNWSGPKWKEARKEWWPDDLDAVFQFLVSQPGVTRDVIGIGGAGLLGVDNSVETARHHAAEVKSLVLISGETLRPQLQFLHEASQLPELFVVSDDDEYPPTQQAMQLLYDIASTPSKKLIHYSAANQAPWLWYEPFDIGKVQAKGGHGTDLFKLHPDLPGIIVDRFVTTLIKTPGHAPADSVACAATINQLQVDGADRVAQRLTKRSACPTIPGNYCWDRWFRLHARRGFEISNRRPPTSRNGLSRFSGCKRELSRRVFARRPERSRETIC